MGWVVNFNVAQKWRQSQAMVRECKVSGNRVLAEKFQHERAGRKKISGDPKGGGRVAAYRLESPW